MYGRDVISPVPSEKPSPSQQKQIDRKYGMFLHYGMNTYLNVEWSDGTAPASTYAAPADIARKAAEWVKNAKRAGMRSIVLTTKHHDGFCLWNSRYTDYDIANPGIENKADIVKAVSDACKKEGIAFSVYYSLWDRHEPSYRDDDKYAYIRYMKNQLQELMTQYGPVHELWFDGAWDRKNEDWHLQEIYDFVKSMQPECQISTNWTIGKRPVDMQEGDSIIYFPSDFRLWDPFLPVKNDPKIYRHDGKRYYLPFESTQTISVIGSWFNHPEDTTVRDVDELEEIFYVATTNDNCLLLNIPPATDGTQNPQAVRNITELAARLGIENGKDFPQNPRRPRSMTTDARATASSINGNDTLHCGPAYAVDSDVSTSWTAADSAAWITVELDSICTFNHVFIIEGENSIRDFDFEIEKDGSWIPVYRSGEIPESHLNSFMGYGTIDFRLPEPLTTDRFRISIRRSNGHPAIYSIRLNSNVAKLKSGVGKELRMPYSHTALTAKLVGPAIDQKDWFCWCVSPIIGKDGKTHILGARWPKAEGMEGWIGPNAEIAHYVGDRPEGPFSYVGTVLKSDMFPDTSTMKAPHNPRLEYVDGKYIFLYICQDPSSKDRLRQRIGMMVADDLNGPWRFAGKDGIMVAASADTTHWTGKDVMGVCNPAFLKVKDKYYIYYSCILKPHAEASHSYGYAVADNLEGPYTLSDAPCIDNISYIEDAQAFEMDGKYYLLTTDNFGRNTGAYGNLIFWESADGRQFRTKDASIALGTLFDYWGTDEERKALMKTPGLFVRSESGKVERPAILKVNGKPAYLYGAGGVNLEGGDVSKSYVFKIDWK